MRTNSLKQKNKTKQNNSNSNKRSAHQTNQKGKELLKPLMQTKKNLPPNPSELSSGQSSKIYLFSSIQIAQHVNCTVQ